MAALTERRKILNAVIAALEVIQQGDDYDTDAGSHIALGDQLELGDNDPDAQLLVVPGDVTKRSDGRKKYSDFLIEIQALVKVGVVDAWLRVEGMLSDIERAMEADETRTMAGYPMEWIATHTLQRQPGSETAGVGVTYRVTYGQPWGRP